MRVDETSVADPRRRSTLATASIGAALVTSAVALAAAPVALDGSYSWVEHTTSEAGGQGVDGAWVARAGFVVFGLSVLWLAHRAGTRWRQPATALHVAFGACLVAVGAFSSRSWETSAAYDRTEDALHSVAATTMGFAFALGVVATATTRHEAPRVRVWDVAAVAASVLIPLTMIAVSDVAGVLQRAMFAIAYLWYLREVLAGDGSRRATPTAAHRWVSRRMLRR